MRSPRVLPGIFLVCAVSALAAQALLAQPVASFSSAPGVGLIPSAPTARLEGRLDIPGMGSEPIALRLVPQGPGLLELPSREIYGYPVDRLSLNERELSFSVGTEGESIVSFRAQVLPAIEEGGAARYEGLLSQAKSRGAFRLSPAPGVADTGLPMEFAVRGGRLRGSLLIPEGSGPHPLVLFVSGAGFTDRDGNNYLMPGKNDALLQLAKALRDLGIASFRYDKRGAGESFLVMTREEDLRFEDYIDDARRAVLALVQDARFSSLTLAGLNEGALVGALALNQLQGSRALDGGRTPGLAVLASSAAGALESVLVALEDTPPGLEKEAEAIMTALTAGNIYPNPTEYFADFFRPSFQPYLSSWLRYDLKAALSSFSGRLVLVHGERDFQVSLEDFMTLATLRPDAPAIVIPRMNHALKDVPPDLDENYRAFTDPAFPLPSRLAEILAAFSRRERLPEDLLRVDGGVPPKKKE